MTKLFRLRTFAPNVHVWNPIEKTSEPAVLPWPVLYILATHNHKHRFQNSNFPNPRIVKEDIQNFTNKLRWRWIFRHRRTTRPLSIRFKKRCPRCPYPVDAALESSLRYLSSSMVSTVAAAATSWKYRSVQFSNLSMLVKLGLRLLRSMNMYVAKADKGFGFCLVPHKTARSTVNNYLETTGMYHRMIVDDHDPCGMFEEYHQIAKAIGQAFDEGYEKSILSTAGEKGSYCAIFQFTVKSQKPQGARVLRPIHGVVNYCFAGLSAWVCQELQSLLDIHAKNLIKDSRHAVNEIRGAPCPAGYKLFKLDVKDFYMSGTYDELMRTISDSLSKHPQGNLLVRAIGFLLKNQFVRTHAGSESMYRVIEGAGMGLPFSGHLSDYAFMCKVEFFTNSPAVRRRFHVAHYWRYRDDILIVMDEGTEFSDTFIKIVKEKSGYYKLKSEEEGNTVSFLEFQVEIKGGKLIPHVSLKPTTMVVPLHTTSSHPLAVHYGWPNATIKRIRALASGQKNFLNIVQELECRFRNASRYFPDRSSWTKIALRPSRVNQDDSSGAKQWWLPLKFHPILRKITAPVLACINQQWGSTWETLFGYTPRICVAWKAGGTSLGESLAGMNRESWKEYS